MTGDWTNRALEALDLHAEIDEEDILDLARVVAHGVERKMAPVSTFLAGLAAGKAGGDTDAMHVAIDRLRDLVEEG